MFRGLTGWMFAALMLGGVVAIADEQAAKDLIVGDKAPKIEVRQFVKGEPVKEFDKGKLYVVEFWATWCPPCRESIPHLTEMQKKHADVTFIGVSIEADDKDVETVKTFVDKMADKMDYRVAIDSQGKMNSSWMEASRQKGIPTAYIVNGDGLVAWIGHPMEMEKSLDAILAGKFDIAAERDKVKKALEKEKAEEKAEAERLKALAEALESGDPRTNLAKLEELINGDAAMENSLGTAKLEMLMSITDESEKTAAYAKKLIDKTFKDDFGQLLNLANTMTEPNSEAIGLILPKGTKYKPDAKLVKLALVALEKAEKISKTEDQEEELLAMMAAITAQALFADGQREPAVTAMKKAIQLAKEAGMDVREFKTTLKTYEAEPKAEKAKDASTEPKK